MSLIDYFTPPTIAEIRAKIAGFAELGNLFLTLWTTGSPGGQLYLAFAKALQYFTAGNAAILRGFVLEYATDPGDHDAYDAGNILLEPAPGFLSALGLNEYYTARPGATFATTAVTLHNASGTPYTLAPQGLTVARSGHPEVTYTNTADATFYLGAGGTYTLAPGATVDIDFAATSPGSAYSAAPGELTVLVTGLPGVTVTNAGAAVGADRMDAVSYRALCRTQAAATSPNGAPDAFRRGATTNLDGSALLRNDGSGAAVGITKLYVSGSSTTGKVDIYYADGDGPADSVDVATANENIMLIVISVPDCVTFGPSTTPGALGGIAAIATNIVPTWAVKYRAKYMGRAVTGPEVKAAIIAALTARFIEYPIGGFDQVAGAGTIYLEEIRGTVKSAHPAIYEATLSSPGGDTAIALGHVARLTTPTGTEVAG